MVADNDWKEQVKSKEVIDNLSVDFIPFKQWLASLSEEERNSLITETDDEILDSLTYYYRETMYGVTFECVLDVDAIDEEETPMEKVMSEKFKTDWIIQNNTYMEDYTDFQYDNSDNGLCAWMGNIFHGIQQFQAGFRPRMTYKGKDLEAPFDSTDGSLRMSDELIWGGEVMTIGEMFADKNLSVL